MWGDGAIDTCRETVYRPANSRSVSTKMHGDSRRAVLMHNDGEIMPAAIDKDKPPVKKVQRHSSDTDITPDGLL